MKNTSPKALEVFAAIQHISNKTPTNKKKLDNAQKRRVKSELDKYNYSLKPGDIANRVMTYGRYQAYRFQDIPDDYVKWAILELDEKSTSSLFEKEFLRRYPHAQINRDTKSIRVI